MSDIMAIKVKKRKSLKEINVTRTSKLNRKRNYE